MDDPNRRGYHPGEEQFYPAGGKANAPLPPVPPSGKRGGRPILILSAIVSVLLIILIVMAVALVRIANASHAPGQVISSQPTTTGLPPTSAPSQATDTPAPVAPTATPTPTPGATLPCNVDVGSWTGGSSDWKTLNGMLLNDGTNTNGGNMNGPTLVAPCDLGNTADYSVQTTIQVTGGQYGQCFGISVRGTPSSSNNWQGYLAGIGNCYNDLSQSNAYLAGPGYANNSNVPQTSFTPGTNAHTYRVTAKGNVITFTVDKSTILTLTDNRYLTGAEVGLWCFGAQLEVTSFEVTAA